MSSKQQKVFVGLSAPHKTRFVRGKAALDDTKKTRVFVGMSGGVDSSVAALLLKMQANPDEFEKLTGRPAPKGRRGYDVTGVYLKCWSQQRLDELGGPGECPSERDAEDARRVASHLGIPFYVFDFEEEYRERVADYLVDGYRRGITPNPDVVCNREIKFGLFMEKALELGAEYVATGHYVRLQQTNNDKRQTIKESATRYTLHTAQDASKDQSYFLWTLTQRQLAHALFPIGDYLKSEVREIARKAGLPTAEKKDSQGICFLGDVALADFIARHIPDRVGDTVTTDGTKIGEHRGAHLYTIGQRHGLNLGKKSAKGGSASGGKKGNAETPPYYVSAIDVERNVVTVAEGPDNPALFRQEVSLTDVNFINQQQTTNNQQRVLARVRYRQPLAEAKLINEQTNNNKQATYRLIFNDPVRFIAPGQSAVFYAENGDPSISSGLEMLGGGVIVAF